MKINVVGDSVIDINFALPRQYLHKYQQEAKIELPFGDKLSTEGYEVMPGGSGANVAVGLAKAGLPVRFLTTLGEDLFADFLRQGLVKLDELELVSQSTKGPTPLSVILRSGGERTILTARDDSERFPKQLPETGWLHIAPLHGEVERQYAQVLQHQVRTSQIISLNPSGESCDERPRSLMSLLKTTKIIILNRHEAISLTRLPKTADVRELLVALRRMGPEVVCLTDGERGGYVATKQEVVFAPALTDRANRVDTTGAGDGFTTGFLAEFVTNEGDQELSELIRVSLASAMANANSVINQLGGQAGLLTRVMMQREGKYVKMRVVE